MPATFDGENLLIILDTSATVDVKRDLYSDWKEWFKTGTNAKYPIAFDTTGGDPLGGVKQVAPYFFLRNDNGWRIRPPEAHANIVLAGNLYRRDPDIDMFVPTLGNYTVSLELEISPQSILIDNTLALGTDLTAVRDILEGDQEHDTSAKKMRVRHKTSKTILVEKDVAGGDHITTDITLSE